MDVKDHSAPKGDEYVHQWKALGAWFLGPRGENKDVFLEIFNSLFKVHVDLRNSYFPVDPPYITNEIRESNEYKEEIKDTKSKLNAIANDLKDSVPFFSPRYQAHMCWDVTLPALLGYMISMLHNQNNVDTATSSVTTVYEKTVGLQLCDMLGYNISDGAVKSWGHITSGGSVSNIESLWAARNIKFSALAVQYAVEHASSDILSSSEKAAAQEYMINVGVQTKNSVNGSDETFYEWKGVALGKCDTKQLLNLDVDESCDLTRRVAKAAELKGKRLDNFGEWVEKCSITSVGIQNFMELHKIKTPVYTCPANCHYSWPKSGTLLGLGSDALIPIPLDIDFRQDVTVLEKKLIECIEKDKPILSVVAVIGSTEESAVDPISKIWHLRNIMKIKHGVNFTIHADAAWGGYFMTMLIEKPFKERISHKEGYMPFMPLTKYVTEQYNNLHKADTITLDPHKSGFCPYPAGALCYRNEAMKSFIAIMHPEVFHGEGDPTMGVYGIEGSKPGAAPTAVLASHQVIGLDVYGYGRILGQCTTTAKLFYCLWLDLAREDDPFVCVPLQILPQKYNKVDDQGVTLGMKIIREKILGKPTSVVSKDEEAMDLLRECGPDTLINTFVVNLKNEDGTINSNVSKANDLQKALSDELNVTVGSSAQRVPMIIMQSALNQDHGEALMQYKDRLGLERDTTDLNVMVNTTMNPWQWNESIQAIGEIFRLNILNCLGKLKDSKDNHEFILCGNVDENGHVFAEYIPCFHNQSRQYQAVVKFKVASSSCVAKKGMFVRAVYPIQLNKFLCECDGNGVEFNLYEDFGEKEVSMVNLIVIDYPRYQHFDMSKHAAYNEKQTYFIYGDEKRVYMTHCIKKEPDFMQIIQLDTTPYGLPEHLKTIGIDVTIKELDGNPKVVNADITDPLDNSNYAIVYRGREYALCSSTAYFERENSKLFMKHLH